MINNIETPHASSKRDYTPNTEEIEIEISGIGERQ